MINKKLYDLAKQAALGSRKEKEQVFLEVGKLASRKGIYPASIAELYLARAKEEISLNFTVPAFNLRGLTFEVAQALFRAVIKNKVGTFIIELAPSEADYTAQPFLEYTTVVTAAALSQGFSGPLFLQGDHFQLKASSQKEIERIKKLIKEAIEAGFYNVDIDASTLVDYSQKTIKQQQWTNFLITAELSGYIRQKQPKGITVSLGGEIGHIGGKNSTEEELKVFIEGYQKAFKGKIGLSKISVQTGTHHGGVVLPDGTLAKVDVDFAVLKKLSRVAREYNMAGAVQHGASTLAQKYFACFPQTEAVEIHLATAFQNIIMDHPRFPKGLLAKMYAWLDREMKKEKKGTDKQFHYRLRKKAWGRFEKQCWALPKQVKEAIGRDLQKRFEFLFKALGVVGTKRLVSKFA